MAVTQPQVTPVKKLDVQQRETMRRKTQLEKALYRIRRDKLTIIGITVLVLLGLISLFAPLITTYVLQIDPFETDLFNNYAAVGTEGHILGTDELGRDHLARLLHGGQVSLGIGFSAAILALTIGSSIGVFTGYYGGVIDDGVIWFITTLNSVPQIFLLLTISALLAPGPLGLILVFSLLGWTGATRLVRGETFALKQREFVLAARAVGASSWRIMFTHILPNVFSLLIISLSRAIGGLILAESALSFLGFGIKPPTPTWGNMLSGGLDLLNRAPHLVVAPGLLISITVLCLYIVGDGLRDAFDPKIAD